MGEIDAPLFEDCTIANDSSNPRSTCIPVPLVGDKSRFSIQRLEAATNTLLQNQQEILNLINVVCVQSTCLVIQLRRAVSPAVILFLVLGAGSWVLDLSDYSARV